MEFLCLHSSSLEGARHKHSRVQFNDVLRACTYRLAISVNLSFKTSCTAFNNHILSLTIPLTQPNSEKNLSAQPVFRAENSSQPDSGPHLDSFWFSRPEPLGVDRLCHRIPCHRRCFQLHQGHNLTFF